MKKISRQRKWQIKQHDRGNCITCGKKAIDVTFCLNHRRMSRVDPLKKLVMDTNTIMLIYVKHIKKLLRQREELNKEISFFRNQSESIGL